MYIDGFNKKDFLDLCDAIGLLGANADKAYITGELNNGFRVAKVVDGCFNIDIAQFNRKGRIYTRKNTRNNDLTFANGYNFTDFEIVPYQDNFSKRDLEKINEKYRKIMNKFFGEEYKDAWQTYKTQKLKDRGFGPAPKSNITYSKTDNYKYEWCCQVAKAKIQAEIQLANAEYTKE